MKSNCTFHPPATKILPHNYNNRSSKQLKFGVVKFDKISTPHTNYFHTGHSLAKIIVVFNVLWIPLCTEKPLDLWTFLRVRSVSWPLLAYYYYGLQFLYFGATCKIKIVVCYISAPGKKLRLANYITFNFPCMIA